MDVREARKQSQNTRLYGKRSEVGEADMSTSKMACYATCGEGRVEVHSAHRTAVTPCAAEPSAAGACLDGSRHCSTDLIPTLPPLKNSAWVKANVERELVLMFASTSSF
jgi:hypothetical protein